MSNQFKVNLSTLPSSQERMQRANRIKQARKMTGLSIDEFAKVICVSRATLTRLERGEAEPRVRTLQLIALYSGECEIWLFFGDKYNKNNNEK